MYYLCCTVISTLTPYKQLRWSYVFLTDGALLAVVGIRDTRSTTDGAASLIRAIVTLVTDTHEGARTHIRVADYTLAIT